MRTHVRSIGSTSSLPFGANLFGYERKDLTSLPRPAANGSTTCHISKSVLVLLSTPPMRNGRLPRTLAECIPGAVSHNSRVAHSVPRSLRALPVVARSSRSIQHGFCLVRSQLGKNSDGSTGECRMRHSGLLHISTQLRAI